MTHLCKASKKKVAADAEKAAERQAEGKTVYQCEHCKRLSHKEDHLCKPEKRKGAKPIAVESNAAHAERDQETTAAMPVGDHVE